MKILINGEIYHAKKIKILEEENELNDKLVECKLKNNLSKFESKRKIAFNDFMKYRSDYWELYKEKNKCKNCGTEVIKNKVRCDDCQDEFLNEYKSHR